MENKTETHLEPAWTFKANIAEGEIASLVIHYSICRRVNIASSNYISNDNALQKALVAESAPTMPSISNIPWIFYIL